MSDDREAPTPTKLTTTKRRWAEEGKFLTGAASRPETDRLPPGQHLVRDWPVLDLGLQPEVPLESFRLVVSGAVDRPATFDWAGLMALPQSQIRSDIHCVTTWSRYDNDWTGIRALDLLDAVGPRDEAAFLMLHGSDGYTTNLPLADFAAPDVVLAHSWQGRPLAREHGGPLRLVVPHLYFWKSAKWIQAIQLTPSDRPGYWEDNAYHMRGDPWSEERYS